MKRSDRPLSCGFQAKTHLLALKAMLSSANCESTDELEEYELYQIVEQNRYMPIASKLGKDERRPPGEVVSNVSTSVTTEAEYTPYSVE